MLILSSGSEKQKETKNRVRIGRIAGPTLMMLMTVLGHLSPYDDRFYHTTAMHRRQHGPTTQRRQQWQYTTSHINTCRHAQNTQHRHITFLKHLSISSTDSGLLHSKWHEGLHRKTWTVVSCTMRTCSPNKEWTTASGQVRAVCTERANWTSDHCHRH